MIVIEGAGSPAEINLKDKDIVNMAVARYCRVPVLLVWNIDLGGAFASLIGTLELLGPEERALVRVFIINKFHGDLLLLTSGLTWLEERTRIPVAGVVPYFKDSRIPEEDSMPLELRLRMKTSADYLLDIAVIGFHHIASFDDFDPPEQESGIRLRYVEPNDRLGNPGLVILPGNKSTISDLAYLREMGLDREIAAHARYSAPVIGICGGYQMLGKWIPDPHHVESDHSWAQGLGLLSLTTVFTPDKSAHQIRGRVAEGRGILGGPGACP